MRPLLAFIAIFPASLAFSQGGPPMLTDDPGTPPKGGWEFNLAYTLQRTHARREAGMPLLDLNYGARDNVQLKIEAPWVLAREAGESTRDLGAALAGTKWRFQEEGHGRPAISTFPQVEFPVLSRSVDEGLAEAATGFLLPIEVQWHRGKWGFNFDAGTFLRRGEGPEWLGGGAVSYEMREGTEFVAELHFEGSLTEQRQDCIAQLGYRSDVSKSTTLLFAIGRSITWHGTEPRLLNLYAGVQFRY
jgi:hypothetical protein